MWCQGGETEEWLSGLCLRLVFDFLYDGAHPKRTESFTSWYYLQPGLAPQQQLAMLQSLMIPQPLSPPHPLFWIPGK